ncbi:MAG: class I mannose-6-phosphate isomerase [Bacteroidales bacterium]|nr:class I mannose-6-phosphate isomerase [Bacteroidales bacterium]MCF8386401.1 class I mannose-6-phosphate isomerase [Bacteroidales bacterium]MCF8397891.1 class I mannose-6-phosphate isomerase [Bacteroidales bacterium]
MFTEQISNFNKDPFVKVKGFEQEAFEGWEDITARLSKACEELEKQKKVIVLECYQGVYHDELLDGIIKAVNPDHTFLSHNCFLPENEIRSISHPDVTDHRIFGYMTRMKMDDLMDQDKLKSFVSQLADIEQGTILVYGHGASLICEKPDLLVYADMARWEIQLRMRRNEVDNLGISNKHDSLETLYKRGYFFDWRICDRLKKKTMTSWDFVMDTNTRNHPRMISRQAWQAGLEQTARQPFSVVPYFDAGPWGGHWMKEVCDLDPAMVNSAWCFNCIPEENSLYLKFGKVRFETPSGNVVFFQPRALLGEAVHARFGDEFPIRFDFLDTMGGGNLSLQVHPLTEYIQEQFGIHYTQDESYYLMDAGEDASVYLGLKKDVEPDAMIRDLKRSEKEAVHFDDTKYINNWPARKHDHFLIPAGTVHCSGRNSMVLEISATPYIFTFKLWDWGRNGLDGKPRPINIDHGSNVIQWERDTDWVKEQLINKIETVAEGDHWKEERTGLHEREFIETRRHWFTGKTEHDTGGGVNVMTLVEGREIIVESPGNVFDPFVVHYAETFIVPAAVGRYTISPHGESLGKECATIKAYVRTNP